MSETIRRARTWSEEAREAAGGPPGPCASNLYVCGRDELAGFAPRIAATVACEPGDAGPAEPGRPRLHFPLATGADLVRKRPEDLARLVAFVSRARETGATVIHCAHGRGRSVAVAIVYLVATGMEMRAAILAVARSRPHVDITMGTVAVLSRVAASLAAAAAAPPADGEASKQEAGQDPAS